MPLVELTAIIPDRPFDPEVFEREIEKVLRDEVRELHRLFKRISNSWTGDKPRMADDVVISGQDAYGEVFTADDSHGNWKLVWLDDGTSGKLIVPRKAKVLRYRGKFRAKTRRGLVGSRAGGKSGDYIYRKSAPWPGVAARKFTETIVRVRQKRFQAAVDRAFDRAARKF